MYKDIDAEIEDFFKHGEEKIDAYLSSIGEEAVEPTKGMAITTTAQADYGTPTITKSASIPYR